MHAAKQKLGHPVFLLSVLLLLLNDWLLKPVFHNDLTGKLSDLAGLFAFPFFLSAFFPAKKKMIHILTALLFVWWKSEWSQSFINALNSYYIPIHRVADGTDYIALVSILLSFCCFSAHSHYHLRTIAFNTVLVTSSFAFMATSMVRPAPKKIEHIDKLYHFNISKSKLISYFNTVQLREIKNHNGLIDFNGDKGVFHLHNTNDTVAYPIDYRKLDSDDTISYKTSYAAIQFSGDNIRSSLKLISLYAPWRKKNFTQKAIEQFEKKVVQKIRKMQR